MNNLHKTIKVLMVLAAFGNFNSDAKYFSHHTHLPPDVQLHHMIPRISTYIYNTILYFFEKLPVKLDPLAEMELVSCQ